MVCSFVFAQSDIPCATAAVHMWTKFAELLGEQGRLGRIFVQLFMPE